MSAHRVRRTRPRRGAVLVIVAIMISALGAMVGLVVDLGVAHNERRKEQEAADAAALAAAAELARGQRRSVAEAQAQATARQYGFTNGSNNVTVAVTVPTTGPNANDARFVQVAISRAMTNLFARMGLLPGVRSSATAVAGLVPGARRCIVALDESADEAFSVGEDARLALTDCGVMVNSSDADALNIEDPSNVSVASDVSVTGGSTSSGGFLFNASAPPEPDPMRHIDNPSGLSATCDFTDRVVGARTTLAPGIYCASNSKKWALDVSASKGNVVVTLAPGRYVFRGGVRFTGKATTLNGTDVTLILTTKQNGAFEPFEISDDATVELSAPATSSGGAIPGVLVFVDRSVTASAKHKISDAAKVELDGALYFPRHEFEIEDDKGPRRINLVGGLVARTVSIDDRASVSMSRDTDRSAAFRRIAVAN